MSIEYYSTETSDWQAACVGSAAFFAGAGGGLWAIQLLSPTVCPKPVLFTFIGAGGGIGGLGASASESSISTTPEPDPVPQPSGGPTPGFTKLVCDKPFSLSQLNRSAGRLSVGEVYVCGSSGGLVVVSAFNTSGSYFNSRQPKVAIIVCETTQPTISQGR